MFSCKLPPAVLAEWPGSFTFYCGNTGEERIRNKSQHKKGGRKKERKTDRKKEDNDDENLLSFWASDERGESELP